MLRNIPRKLGIKKAIHVYKQVEGMVETFKKDPHNADKLIYAGFVSGAAYGIIPLQFLAAEAIHQFVEQMHISPLTLIPFAIGAIGLSYWGTYQMNKYMFDRGKDSYSIDIHGSAAHQGGMTSKKAAKFSTIFDLIYGAIVNPSDWKGFIDILSSPFMGGDATFFLTNTIVKPIIFLPYFAMGNATIVAGIDKPIVKIINKVRKKMHNGIQTKVREVNEFADSPELGKYVYYQMLGGIGGK